MMAAFDLTFKRGTRRPLHVRLDGEGTLAGATVKFNARDAVTGELVCDHLDCAIVDAEAREVQFDWLAEHVAVAPRVLRCEFYVVYADMRPETLPAGADLLVEITQDVA